jgi:hypothetical protein
MGNRWRRLGSLSVLALGLGVRGTALVLTGQVEADLKAVVLDRARHDFGRVEPGIALATAAILRNHSPHPQRIQQVTVTCGCTTPEPVGGRTLAPGETLKVPIRLDTTERAGRMTSRVEFVVQSIEPDQKRQRALEFFLEAEVATRFDVRPDRLDFGRLEDDRPRSLRFEIRPRPDAPADSYVVHCGDPRFQITEVPTRHPTAATRVFDVTFQKDRLVASTDLASTILVTCESAPEYRRLIGVSAEYRSPFELDARHVVIGPETRGGVERTLTLRSTRPCRIEDLNSDDARVRPVSSNGTENRRKGRRRCYSGGNA